MFNHAFTRSLLFTGSLALFLSTFPSTVTTASSFNEARTTVDEPIMGRCDSLNEINVGTFSFPMSFTVEGIDGGLLDSPHGYEFLLRTPAEPDLNITQYVTPSADYFSNIDPDLAPWNRQITPRLSSYGPATPVPATLILECAATRASELEPTVREAIPFPNETMLIVQWSGRTVASASLAGLQPLSLVDTPFGETVFANTGESVPAECLAEDNSSCTLFSDLYNLIINTTGRRLSAQFAHLLVGLTAYYAHQEHEQNGLDFGQAMSMALTPPRMLCTANFYSALNVLSYGATPNDTVYQLGAVGRGLAQSLTDPNNNSWPEFDACMALPDQDGALGVYGVLLEGLVYLLPFQVLFSDIPLGLSSTSVFGDISSSRTHLAASARIPWEFLNQNPPTPIIGQPYAHSAAARGLPAPTYAVTSGNLPAGLVLDSITGLVTGTPTTSGSSTFTITATNFLGSLSGTFTITIDAPAVASAAPASIKRPSLKMTRKGSAVKVSGTVDAAYTGTRVTLQRLDGKKWKRVKIIRVKSTKKFSATVNVKSKSKMRYRIVAGSETSRTVRR